MVWYNPKNILKQGKALGNTLIKYLTFIWRYTASSVLVYHIFALMYPQEWQNLGEVIEKYPGTGLTFSLFALMHIILLHTGLQNIFPEHKEDSI